MPTLPMMMIPPPKGWDEFEEITLSALKIRWSSPNLVRHGRQGQSQAGVDIYGSDELGRFAGVQCKQTAEEELPLATVEEEVAKAETFEPPLASFHVATTVRRDAKLQREVRLLSERRLRDGKFPVGILFWEDIAQDLLRNETEFAAHYPQIKVPETIQTANRPQELLAILDLTYYGLTLHQRMGLIFGELGEMAGEDPMQFERMMRGIEGAALTAMPAASSAELHTLARKLAAGAVAIANGEAAPDWRPLNDTASTILGIIEALEYRCEGRRLAAFSTGRILGRWDMVVVTDTPFSPAMEAEIASSIRGLLHDPVMDDEVRTALGEYRADERGGDYRIPHRVFNLVRRRLRHEAIG